MVCLRVVRESIVQELFSCNRHVKKTIVKWLNESAITSEKFKLQKRVDRARGRYFNVVGDCVVGSPDLGAEMPSECQ